MQIHLSILRLRCWLGFILSCLLLTSACGGITTRTPFALGQYENRQSDLAAVLRRIRGANQTDSSVVVGVTTTPSRLFAWDARTARKLWDKALDQPRTRPYVAGDTVYVSEADDVIAFSLRSGAELFSYDGDDLGLVGAAGQGGLSTFVLSTGMRVGARSKIVVAEQGTVLWDAEIPYAAGSPALISGMIFLPWGNQHVSVIDAHDGHELCHLRIRDDVIGHAFLDRGSLYIGQRGLFRVTNRIASGSKTQAAYLMPELGELPGSPTFMPDAYAPRATAAGATYSQRLVWRPSGTGEEVKLENDAVYWVYFRLVFAINPQDKSVRWVHEHEEDIVGANVDAKGLVVADKTGNLVLLSPRTGQKIWGISLGVKPVVATFSGDASSGRTIQDSTDARPLKDQLLSAAKNQDSRLSAGQSFAITRLGEFQDPTVTQDLIQLCEDQGRTQPVRQTACETLAKRTTGAEYVLAALERHASFLKLTTAPTLGPLAQAALAMNERRAAPLIASHLLDPNTQAADIAVAGQVLGQMGDRTTTNTLERFIRVYHVDSSEPELPVAVAAIMEAYVRLDNARAKTLLEELGGSGLAVDSVKQKAQELLVSPPGTQSPNNNESGPPGNAENRSSTPGVATSGTSPAAPPPQPAGDTGTNGSSAGNQPAPQVPSEPAVPDTPALPVELSAQAVSDTLEPIQTKLKGCLGADRSLPPSVRVVIRVRADGGVEGVSASPPSSQSCIEPLIRQQTFPRMQRTRQQVTYTIRR